jgi:hypothetical protein
MKNKISIDDLVRQHVAKGEEPHNLGAWANMERMLDGKNPYQEEEKEKKRPWLFLLLGLLVCSTAVIGSYYYLSGPTESQNELTQLPNEKSSDIQNGNNQPQSNDEILVFEDDSESNANARENSNSYSYNNTEIENEYANAVASKTTNASSFTQPNLGNNSSTNQFTAQQNNPVEKSSNKLPLEKSPALANQKSTVQLNGQNENSLTASSSNTKKQSSKEYAQSDIIQQTSENLKSQMVNNDSKKSEKSTISPTIQEKYLDTTKYTKITKRLAKENGKTRYVNDSVKFNVVEEKVREVVNPRYVALTQEQEKAAQRKTALASMSSKLSKASMDVMNEKSAQVAVKTPTQAEFTAKSETTVTNKNEAEKKASFFSLFKKTAQKLNQKAVNVAHTRFPIYTGMFAGVNAAIINSPHNFGGFQAGLTAMTPLSRLFTLSTEARFIHKNNSGYTIKDGRMDLLSTAVDSSSIFKTKIYSYQMDSVSNSYNLQNFYTLQMPIIVSANIRKFNAYAGINLNYGFRLNVKGSQRSAPHTIIDTVPSSMLYTQRTSSEMKFSTNDFGSRLGIGYTVGGAYNFNPNLYLDLRMSNPFWDNTSGAAKQEISDVFFKIPSFQLSLGYRFRKYKAD